MFGVRIRNRTGLGLGSRVRLGIPHNSWKPDCVWVCVCMRMSQHSWCGWDTRDRGLGGGGWYSQFKSLGEINQRYCIREERRKYFTPQEVNKRAKEAKQYKSTTISHRTETEIYRLYGVWAIRCSWDHVYYYPWRPVCCLAVVLPHFGRNAPQKPFFNIPGMVVCA